MESFMAAHLGEREVREETGGGGEEYSDSRSIQVY